MYCDIQVSDANDASVLIKDLMDMNRNESMADFDARMSGFERVNRAPRESMAVGAEMQFRPTQVGQKPI